MKHLLKRLVWHFAPETFVALASPPVQEFAIAVYRGESPLTLHPATSGNTPVLTRRDVHDVPAAFVADPFMCRRGENWYMFMEVMNQLTHKGQIGVATSNDRQSWSYQRIVLAEPFHLSYPHVFEWSGDFFMIPETGEAGGIRLYRATGFPDCWSLVKKIIDDGVFLDSSIFQYQERWWLFTANPEADGSLTLRLFSALEPLGPWEEHPRSPIMRCNLHFVRPAGRVVIVDGRPIRFAQDMVPVYGSQVHAFEILELTATTYRERKVGNGAVLTAGSAEWNGGGMHHIDAHRLPTGEWIACVDGFPAN